VELVSIVGAKWARYASIESKEGCSQSTRSVMLGGNWLMRYPACPQAVNSTSMQAYRTFR
jgi:hypothetical protein